MSKKIRLRALELASLLSYVVGIESIIVGVAAIIYLSLRSNTYDLPGGLVILTDLIVLTIYLAMAFVLFYIGNYCSRKIDEIKFSEWKVKNEQA